MRLTEKEAKSIQIAEIIRRELNAGNLRPGSRLEGENLLAERFCVGRQVVRSALKLLKKENLIRSARGGGTYVNDYIPSLLPARKIRIGCVYWRNVLRENSFMLSFQRLLFSAKEKNCELYLACEKSEDALISWVRNYQLDGLLIGGYVDDSLVQALNDADILFLLLGNYKLKEPVNRLEKDMFHNVKTAMSTLLKRYHFTQVSGIFSNLAHLGPQQAFAGIRAAAEENGLPVDESRFLCAQDGNGYQAMESLISEKKIGRNDIVYLSDLTFPGAARSIFEHGLTLKQRPYLFLDMSLTEVPYPDLVGCFLYEDDAYADQALDCFLDIFHGRVKRPWRGTVKCKVMIS